VPRLLAANPVAGRTVLTVGKLLGLSEEDNPHRWYDPVDVNLVANVITSDLKRLDPRDTFFFARRASLFQSRDLAAYQALIARIRARYGGTPVGASESIFALQAPALGLRLITPPGFMKAVSEGTEATAQDTTNAQQQLTDHAVKVWIFNSQNVTPDVQQLNRLARSHGIPIATVTETLTPVGATFEQWQVAQLRGIARGLRQATGR
jgi:zinc/manganese transport system substrate-binding protein